MTEKAFQDYYPDEFNHCYGCGKLNQKGHQLKSRWDGDETVAYFTPKPHHTAVPGFVYGGLIASLVDCHGTGTAAAAAYREAGRPLGSDPSLRFVTASLQVDFKAPTPLGPELEIRGKIEEITPKKVIMTIEVKAEGKVCALGRVVAVRIPDTMFK
ncbi:MAG: PaaI family thioesterase [Desulfobacter sp.]|nr:MAG: PaaI family thioesterase [Desulfobacter sp.]